jgi:hypothetical protein
MRFGLARYPRKNFVVDVKIKSRLTANAAMQQAGLEKQF